jgi:hypothetical protein
MVKAYRFLIRPRGNIGAERSFNVEIIPEEMLSTQDPFEQGRKFGARLFADDKQLLTDLRQDGVNVDESLLSGPKGVPLIFHSVLLTDDRAWNYGWVNE